MILQTVQKGWTVWDIINIKGPMTFQEFVDYFKRAYNANILGIASNYNVVIPEIKYTFK